MKILRLENTSPFQGLAELVAYDEGLFEKEGIKIEWIDRESHVDKSPTLHITDHRDASRFASHGSQLEQGKEWLDRAWVLSEDPEVAAHLGETLWRMGRPEDAKRLWDEALADNPDSPPLKRAIERRSP